MIALRAAGWGDGWWRVGGRCFVSDGRRLWAWGAPARSWGIPSVVAVVGDADGVRAVASTPRGLFDVRLLPDGTARWLPRGTPLPAGPSLAAWVADGVAYVARDGRTRAVDALGPGERGWVGGGGVVVVEGPDGVRAALPGRTPTPRGPGAGVRVADDGRALAFVGPEGPVAIDLAGGARAPLPGLPVSATVAWVDGWLRAGRLRLGPPVREGSAARSGTLLAGPAGRVWDLAAGRAVTAPGTVLAGATVATADRFVTVDGETGRGWVVGPAGPEAPVVLPLDPDDAVTSGVSEDGVAFLSTALGAGFRVDARGRVTPAEGRRVRRVRARDVETGHGVLRATGDAAIGGVRWWWNDDGWLWSA